MIRIGGWPLVAIGGKGRPARGIVAIGWQATGIVAIGYVACGVVAIGPIAVGVVSVGFVAFASVVGLGAISTGLLLALGALGLSPGVAGGGLAVGGDALPWNVAFVPLFGYVTLVAWLLGRTAVKEALQRALAERDPLDAERPLDAESLARPGTAGVLRGRVDAPSGGVVLGVAGGPATHFHLRTGFGLVRIDRPIGGSPVAALLSPGDLVRAIVVTEPRPDGGLSGYRTAATPVAAARLVEISHRTDDDLRLDIEIRVLSIVGASQAFAVLVGLGFALGRLLRIVTG